MDREYHKWYSGRLGREMEILVFGHAGAPVLVFPTSMGRFFEYEDRGMIAALQPKIDAGHIQVFCVDSVDEESWYNRGAHPRWRVLRHVQYDQYVLEEVLPFVRSKNGWDRVTATGASFGGYHAVNFSLRHPDRVARVVSMSGAFDIHQFLHGYWDEDCYFNNPPDYVRGMTDPWYLDRYRAMGIVLATGEHDICRGENEWFSGILRDKGIPNYLDVWGDGMIHDWPWWRRMAVKFL